MPKWSLGFALLAALNACQAPHDSLDSLWQRSDTALRQLPAERSAGLLGLGRPSDAKPAEPVLEAGVLTLEQAREIALRANPDIEGARARLEAALARISEARSFYFPQVEFANNANRTFLLPNRQSSYPSPFSLGTILPRIPTSFTLLDLLNTVSSLSGGFMGGSRVSSGNQNAFSDFRTALSATWTIFDGFVREARLLSVRQSCLASAMALADAKRLLIQAMDTAYYQTQLGLEQLRIAQADEQFSRKQFDEVSKRYEARQVSKADVLNFEVRVRAAQANVVAARGLVDTGRVVLAELLALTDAQLPPAVELAPLQEESEPDMRSPAVDEWLERAMLTRPDLTQAQYVLNATAENIVLARGQFYPDLSLRGSWGFEKVHNLAYSDDDQASAIGLEMHWPLFTGGYRSAQLKRANAEWWQASAALRQKRLQVCREVRQAIIDLANTQEQVRLQRMSLAAALENRRLVETQYAAGKATLVRLNEAQRDFVQTDGALAQARLRLRQAWSNLHAAAGTYYQP